MVRPGLLLELPSFSVSSCTLPDPPSKMDEGYFQFYLAGKLIICGGWRSLGNSYSAQCYRLSSSGWVSDSTLPAGRTADSVSLPPGANTAVVVAGWVEDVRSPHTDIYDGTAWHRGPETPTAGRVSHCQVGC